MSRHHRGSAVRVKRFLIKQRKQVEYVNASLYFLYFIIEQLKKQRKHQADKGTNTPLNRHIYFDDTSTSESDGPNDEYESPVNTVLEARIEELNNKTKEDEARIEILNNKIRRLSQRKVTNCDRKEVFLVSTILLTIVTCSWSYFCLQTINLRDSQREVIFSNILCVQTAFIVLCAKYCV